ncbi:BZIP transcription factor [Colletotrichum tofieldiae]|uniref:BZIP transcription factor n=1 Tax=Colletotrichum tofieldiae TaxID=708197 RepID=A0A166TQJ1_9PEZI|nr:bZIP transcription factor [Colletotrichum tofieldiae]GKT76612.1 BZIP transcription factor [Colletotrichum tofieldiae]GKT87663.1 BZIP transcription factor [Colletotrichum tofieldiae]
MTTSNQNVDNIDALLDFSEYDNMSYQSPSLSPAATAKNTFTRPSVSTVATPTLPSASQPLTGPSHQYDLYKQQTGIVPGALASTLAVNEVNPHISGYNSGYGMEYLGGGLSPENDLFDFNTSPSQNSTGLDMDMEFDSPPDSQYFFPNPTVNPSAIAGQESPVVPSQQSNVGRLWPGMHSQAALAKAQAQQRQQQQIIQQQRQQQMGNKPRTKSQQPTDPIVEQKITQLLNSMRAKPAQEGDSPTPLMNLPRSKKDEEDMDEDERLLASEEGKKLSSKERRQLRNKVSARAFRSRRKEYITQLEAEIANKVSENGDLRAHNRALQDENKRLQDLTRMLLASPSFSNFLDHLSTNPQAAPQPTASVKVERQPEQRQIPKDINPYANQSQQQQIGVAMVPEQNMDFSMLNIDNDAYNFQPQVFAVLETPDVPVTIDTNVLSGKSSNFVGEQFESDDEKIELPALEAPKVLAPEIQSQTTPEEEVFDDEFENDPEFALYHSSPAPASEGPIELDAEIFSHVDIFGGVESEKVLARYELIDASEEEQNACVAMAKVQRIAASLEPVLARLESLVL